MNHLYLECGMGAAGDMLTAALLELHPAPEEMLARINDAGIPGVMVTAEPSVKCGISGTRVRVRVNETEEQGGGHEHAHHAHGHLSDILHMIDHLRVSDIVKENAKAVYGLIAEAESQVHGEPVGNVHFHEVGALDAVADVVGVCMLMEELNPASVSASPVATGGGFVRCAHGLLPVPAPATALLLNGIPSYGGGVDSELCTPTGAALLKHFVQTYGPRPVMTAGKIGYGMGYKDFERANCVRAFFGIEYNIPVLSDEDITNTHVCTEAEPTVFMDTNMQGIDDETITELSCNLDDMTPEALAFAQELLMEAGALDVYVTSIVMKKGRAGFIFTCLCKNADAETLAALIFKHTSTLGLRVDKRRRLTLRRETLSVETPYGPVRVKTATGFGITREKPEYEDVAGIARREGISFAEAAKRN
jgi:uncharacterized protein (TIGR00299 family) protein